MRKNCFKLLVVFMLLTNYFGQTYANATMDCAKHSNHVQMQTSHDHMMHQVDTSVDFMHHDMSTHDCCESTCHCAVSSCSSTIILITQFPHSSLNTVNILQFESGEGSPVSSISIVYRPPIFA